MNAPLKRLVSACIVVCVVHFGLLGGAGVSRAVEARLLEVRRIWDRAAHNAFTDLIRFGGRWYCAFREGEGHVSDDGRLRVLRSPDARAWTSVALMTWDGGDVRDAKLSVTADGRLMLGGAVRFLEPVDGQTHQSVAWFSGDGTTWSPPGEIGDANLWMWSATWHQGVGYSIGYSVTSKRFIRLYHTRDGRAWETLADDLFPGGTYANETSLIFTPDDGCCCLLRRDSHEATAHLGVARPPYTKWKWKDLGVRIGGPKMIQLPDGRLIAGVRLYDGKVRTGLCRIDVEKGTLREILTLPSGGDTSYPGLVWHEGVLWMSYYASHEGKTSIYLAKIGLSPAPDR
ncbi:MAG: exo-alpha-sialidase [Planctomycetota bacterium]|jgi:hypothetical protein